MKCPSCGNIPMPFGWFLVIGWVHIRCRHCSSRLVLKSVGERFWSVLAGGAVIVAAIYFFLDTSFHLLGENGVLYLFLVVIFAALVLSMYVAWKDSQFEIRDSH